MAAAHPNSFKARKSLKVGAKNYTYFSLKAVEKEVGDLSRLPVSLRILMENLVRHEDGTSVKKEDIAAFADWVKNGGKSKKEINFRCARVLMQDFTGVPAVVDLAAMRDAMGTLGGDAKKINPLVPVDLVIDHSVIVDNFGNNAAFGANVKLEYERNLERYQFLRWGQMNFDNFRVVPPGTGICHQVNLEYLSQVVWTKKDGKETVLYPDTLVGTDSHTTMVNGLAVLGWGVGGIEAEASMLGQPQPMVIPEVVGFKLTGKLPEGATATDLVLTVTQMLRKKGVVNKFVEFYGEGLDEMPLANRATIANMAPEYGATCGFFPVDGITIGYLKTTNRGAAAKIVEAYAKKQGLWRSRKSPEPVFTDTLSLDMSDVVPSQIGRASCRKECRSRCDWSSDVCSSDLRRGLCQEAGPVAFQEIARARLHRHALARHERRRAEPGRPEAPAGPRAALRGQPAVRGQHGEGIRPQGRRQARPIQI